MAIPIHPELRLPTVLATVRQRPEALHPTIPAGTVQTSEDGIGMRALLCGKLTDELLERLPLTARPNSPDAAKVNLRKIHHPSSHRSPHDRDPPSIERVHGEVVTPHNRFNACHYYLSLTIDDRPPAVTQRQTDGRLRPPIGR